jgi:predicted nucleotidyltransferase
MVIKLVEASGHQLRVELVPDPVTSRGLPDTPMGQKLLRHRRAVTDASARRGASNVRVFGSVARGTDVGTSDVDLLVDLEPHVGLLALIGLEREISEILGRDVDIVPAANLKAGLKSQALADAIPL